MIHLFSISNTRLTETRHSSIWIIKQFLQDNNVKSICYDYWYCLRDLLNPNYVREINDMPNLLKMIDNYKSGHSIADGLEMDTDSRTVIGELIDDITKIDIKNGDIFGFSITNISYFYLAFAALYIRSINPNVRIVFGGYHVSLSKNLLNVFLDNHIADIMVVDDGCQPMLDIAQGKIESGIVTGKFKQTIPWPQLTRTDAILANGHLPTVTSFGCPFNCTFCASKRPYIKCDMYDFLQYLKVMSSKGFKYLEVNDDNFNGDLDRAIEVTKVIGLSKFELWSLWAHPSNITPEWVELLKESRCNRVFMGVESFSDKVLILANKASDQTVNDGIRAIDLLANQEILATVGLIVGMPGETDEEFNKTLNTAKYINDKYGKYVDISPVIFKMYPNSDHYNNPDKYGITFKYWEDSDIPKSFEIEGMSPDSVVSRLQTLQDECRSLSDHVMYGNIGETKIIR